jgi:aerobic-type carbon monoxide dehydrogenase small subunit (CoxS/CutS family)
LSKASYKLKVNGKHHDVTVEPDEPLLWVLRDQLKLTGAKYGCGEGRCGACMVIIDGVARNSCRIAIAGVGDLHVETIEGLGDTDKLSPLQKAFKEHTAFGCGYCTPGQIVSATAFLRNEPDPDRSRIVKAMNGNLCRCAAYPNILAAIESVVGKAIGDDGQ